MAASGLPAIQAKKVTTIELLNQPIAASGTFTGAWHDTQEDGTNYVTASLFANQSGTSFRIEETDDQSNASLLHVASAVSNAPTASVLSRISANIKNRFWRVVFVNSVTAVVSIEITTTATIVQLLPQTSSPGPSNSGDSGVSTVISTGVGNTGVDNITTIDWIPTLLGGGQTPLEVAQYVNGGAFSGTTDAVRRFWSQVRTPTVFKQVSTAAIGSTALWTPGSGNKFRLLKYVIEITANAAAAAAGVLVIKLLDAAGDIAMDHSVFIPAAAATAFGVDDFIIIDLGSFGILSTAANNVLNVNLSFALTAGAVNVIVMGVEE